MELTSCAKLQHIQSHEATYCDERIRRNVSVQSNLRQCDILSSVYEYIDRGEVTLRIRCKRVHSNVMFLYIGKFPYCVNEKACY